MADAFSKIRDHYVESIAKTVPIYRAGIFLFFVLLLVISPESNPVSTFLGLFEPTIAEIFGSEKGLIWNLRLADIAIAAFLTTLTAISQRLVKTGFFTLFGRVAGKERYVQRLREAAAVRPQSREHSGAADELEQRVEAYRRELMRRAGLSEVLIGVSICIGITWPTTKDTDTWILAACLFGVIGIQWTMFKLYTAKLFPSNVVLQSLKGGLADFGEEFFQGAGDPVDVKARPPTDKVSKFFRKR